MYARPQVQHLLKPLVVSWGYETETPTGSALVDYHEWMGTRDLSAFLSVPAAIRFQERHAWGRRRAACHALAREALEQIEQLTALPSFYPDDSWYVQMFAAPLPDSINVSQLQRRLHDRYRIEVPLHEWDGKKLIRVSVQAYNTPDDIKALINALQRVLSERV